MGILRFYHARGYTATHIDARADTYGEVLLYRKDTYQIFSGKISLTKTKVIPAVFAVIELADRSCIFATHAPIHTLCELTDRSVFFY